MSRSSQDSIPTYFLQILTQAWVAGQVYIGKSEKPGIFYQHDRKFKTPVEHLGLFSFVPPAPMLVIKRMKGKKGTIFIKLHFEIGEERWRMRNTRGNGQQKHC